MAAKDTDRKEGRVWKLRVESVPLEATACPATFGWWSEATEEFEQSIAGSIELAPLAEGVFGAFVRNPKEWVDEVAVHLYRSLSSNLADALSNPEPFVEVGLPLERLFLELPVQGEQVALLHRLPWELLFHARGDSEHKHLRADCEVVRLLSIEDARLPHATNDTCFRVQLFEGARMKGTENELSPGEFHRVYAGIEATLNELGAMGSIELRRDDANGLTDKPWPDPFDVLQYFGNAAAVTEKTSSFDEPAALVLSDDAAKMLSATQLARALPTPPPILVVLSACETWSLAYALLAHGVPAVVATLVKPSPDAERRWIEAFHGMLARGDSVGCAAREASRDTNTLGTHAVFTTNTRLRPIESWEQVELRFYKAWFQDRTRWLEGDHGFEPVPFRLVPGRGEPGESS